MVMVKMMFERVRNKMTIKETDSQEGRKINHEVNYINRVIHIEGCSHDLTKHSRVYRAMHSLERIVTLLP